MQSAFDARASWTLTLTLVGLACTPTQPADAPEPGDDSPGEHASAAENLGTEDDGVAPAPAPGENDEPALVENSSTSSTESQEAQRGPAPADPEAALEKALALCEDMCEQMDQSCSKRAAEFCRASCGDYETAARKCPIEVEAALSCQATADDFLLCSNISAPSCASLFKRLQDCRSGAVPPQEHFEQAQSSEQSLPPGLSSLRVPALGILQVLPTGARVEKKEGAVRVRIEDENGTEFALLELPDEPLEPTAKRVLKNATQFVGNECQPKLRLHGRFETEGVVHIRFDTVCEDGTVRSGMLHFFDSKVVAVQALTPSGQEQPEEAIMEAVLFGFERQK